MPNFLSSLVRDPSQPFTLVNTRTGLAVAENIVTAFDSKTRRTGLLAHDVFPIGSAMIIAPSNAIHTFFMKFPIDVLFVAKDGRIVKVHDALPSWRIAVAWTAFGVIELAAGARRRAGAEVGDYLTIRPQQVSG